MVIFSKIQKVSLQNFTKKGGNNNWHFCIKITSNKYLEVEGIVLYSLGNSPSAVLAVDRSETVKKFVEIMIKIKLRKALIQLTFGGTVWESNPPDHTRWSQAVLKTVEDTSTPSSPI
jgi:hypothetical protein